MLIKKIDPTVIDCYANLSQHYEAEFSPLTGKVPSRHGLYEITPIDENHDGYLARLSDGTPVGFAVVNVGNTYSDIAEFYVIPTYRKHGLGRDLAFHVFDLYPGAWQVRQISGADKAHIFWISVISEYTNGRLTNSIENDPEWGTVRIQRFHSR
jgi:predicted acetyltransferase